MAKVIVLGNEKGGSGKTTICIHLVIALCKLGFRVATIDIDCYQQSLGNYLTRRNKTAEKYKIPLCQPEHFTIPYNHKDDTAASRQAAEGALIGIIEQRSNDFDFIVIDTPGSHTHLNRLAHSYADHVITPVNDSYVDIMMLGQTEQNDPSRVIPGLYSAMFFEQRLKRASRDRQKVDWVVAINRTSATKNIRNSAQISSEIKNFSKKMGFRIGSGLGDRVIFKELYPLGLTLYDREKSLKQEKSLKISPSLLAARQEMRHLLNSLQITEIDQAIKQPNSQKQDSS